MIVSLFQHTCPHEAGTTQSIWDHHHYGVSTHVPARGGHVVQGFCSICLSVFQHTCPHEAGTKPPAHEPPDEYVSTHVPARGGHLLYGALRRIYRRFNTRARTRRAPAAGISRQLIVVFQHTCPHEAGTLDTMLYDFLGVVSTHVPARGGHASFKSSPRFHRMFQHTCPHEAGTCEYQLAFFTGDVSTHVPARGGHRATVYQSTGIISFNTRARTRRALSTCMTVMLKTRFQHTCPREAGTQYRFLLRLYIWVSTHVPARGGHKIGLISSYISHRAFQHTCPREAGTLEENQTGAITLVSTHVPARGGHSIPVSSSSLYLGFNTRARARRAQNWLVWVASIGCFNTRARARRARR